MQESPDRPKHAVNECRYGIIERYEDKKDKKMKEFMIKDCTCLKSASGLPVKLCNKCNRRMLKDPTEGHRTCIQCEAPTHESQQIT